MNRKIIGAAVLAAALAGCGGGGSGGGATVTQSNGSATVSQAPASGNAGYSAGPGGNPVTQTVRTGQPFSLAYPYANGGSASWRITLRSAVCGGPGIFDRKVLAGYSSSDGQPLSAPQPDARMQFCLARFSVTNTGNSEDTWGADVTTINVGDTAYSPESGTGEDVAQAYDEAAPHGSDYGLNPGASGDSYAVYQIPAGVKPTSVSAPDNTALHTINGLSFQVVITVP